MKVQAQSLKEGQKVKYYNDVLTVAWTHTSHNVTAVGFQEWSHCVISSQFGSWSSDHEFEVVE
jgi:hypothetical protein